MPGMFSTEAERLYKTFLETPGFEKVVLKILHTSTDDLKSQGIRQCHLGNVFEQLATYQYQLTHPEVYVLPPDQTTQLFSTINNKPIIDTINEGIVGISLADAYVFCINGETLNLDAGLECKLGNNIREKQLPFLASRSALVKNLKLSSHRKSAGEILHSITQGALPALPVEIPEAFRLLYLVPHDSEISIELLKEHAGTERKANRLAIDPVDFAKGSFAEFFDLLLFAIQNMDSENIVDTRLD